jgi:hypothetical protein
MIFPKYMQLIQKNFHLNPKIDVIYIAADISLMHIHDV